MLFNTLSNTFNLSHILEGLHKVYNSHAQFTFEMFSIDERDEIVLKVHCELDVDAKDGSRRIVEYKGGLRFAIDGLMKVPNIEEEFFHRIHDWMYDFVSAFDEDDAGNYAHIRLYLDSSGKSNRPLLGNPKQNIEGWQFNKARGLAPPNPANVGNIEKRVKTIATGLPPQYVPVSAPPTVPAPEITEIDEEQVRMLKNMTTKKKVRIVKPKIDPNKVKKPRCPTHDLEMTFSPVKGKWLCGQTGCKLVATPAKDEDDRSVTIGKGATSLRIVVADGEATALLISDDNIALDITGIIDISGIVEDWGLVDLALTAVESDRESFVDPVEHSLPLRLSVGVIAASDFLDVFKD